MSSDLYMKYLEQCLGKPQNEHTSLVLTGREAVEALWPLNDRFKPYIHRIAALPYEAKFEKEADDAIEALVFADDDWSNLSAQAWRVLLERHHQALFIFQLQENEPFIPVPEALPAKYYTNAALLFVLHQWKLPLPIADRSALAATAGTVPGSLTRQ
ncbi:MAG: hypothetical protein K9L79_01535 [Methylobacter tundripaludum]|nr:hypothetical protein [Methylobacter tundripaludum]